MFRALRGGLGGIVLITFALGLGVLIPRPFLAAGAVLVLAAAGPSSPKATRTVLLLSTDIHTDLALPASPDVAARFSFMADDGVDPAQPGVAYIIAGWGSRSFYIETPTWSDLKPGPVFNALTYDSSVMHMALGGEIDQTHPTVTVIELDEASFQRLLDSVLASFTLGKDGARIVVPDAQYGEYDLFYEAEGLFNAFVGCNVWTAATLRQAGLITGWWTPLPGLLTVSLKLHNPDLLSGL